MEQGSTQTQYKKETQLKSSTLLPFPTVAKATKLISTDVPNFPSGNDDRSHQSKADGGTNVSLATPAIHLYTLPSKEKI